MRTYGRRINLDGSKTWVEVQTDTAGHDDYVWITTLLQTIQLTPNESPFFANYGIPVQQSIVTQTYPDFYVALTQSQFAPYFASLSINRVPQSLTANPPLVEYDIKLVTNQGTVFNATIAQ